MGPVVLAASVAVLSASMAVVAGSWVPAVSVGFPLRLRRRPFDPAGPGTCHTNLPRCLSHQPAPVLAWPLPMQADRGVEARGLRPADAAVVARLREGEQEKEKSYSALCWLPRPLTQADVALLAGLGELELEQQTPVRVLHRRANMMRRRAVRDLRVKRLVEPGTPPTGQQQLAKPQQQQQLQQVKDEEVGIQRQQQQQQQQPQEASAVSLSAAAAAAAPPPQQQAGAGGASGAAAAGAGGAPGAAAAAGGATAAAGPGEYFELHMRTQAGTYVKEFVTGGHTHLMLAGLPAMWSLLLGGGQQVPYVAARLYRGWAGWLMRPPALLWVQVTWAAQIPAWASCWGGARQRSWRWM